MRVYNLWLLDANVCWGADIPHCHAEGRDTVVEFARELDHW